MSGPRFKLPDLPADRPTVPVVAHMICAYYDKDGNGAGGNCHVVLDDGNYELSHVQYCLELCELKGDVDGAAIMRVMLLMTSTQRRKLTRQRRGFSHSEKERER